MSSRPVGENIFIGPFNKLQYIRDDLVKSVCYGEWQKHRILKPFTSKIWNLILLITIYPFVGHSGQFDKVKYP